MSKFQARYPDGAAGAALFVLRVVQALTGVAIAAGLPAWAAHVARPKGLAVIAAGLLLVGFGVRPAAVALTLLSLAAALCWQGAAQWLVLGHAGSGLCLALLGGGAYSLDARLFGRRVIDLAARRDRKRS